MELKNLRIKKEDAVLVLIDFQERLVPAMDNKDFLVDKTGRLINGAKAFQLPILVTQQYTKGLGETISRLKEHLTDIEHIEKKTFSAWGEAEFVKALSETGKKTVLLSGIETHICVLQTAMDLIERGYKVFLIEDCTSSRSSRDMKYGIKRMKSMGVNITTLEAALMEMVEGAESPQFKQISRIIK